MPRLDLLFFKVFSLHLGCLQGTVVLVKHVHWWLQYQWKWRFQCWLAVYLLFIYFSGYPVGYESELVLLLFEPQYAYCAHLCNCCEEKNHYNRLVNLSSCRGFLCRKIKGVYPSRPVSLNSVTCCYCALAAQEHSPAWKTHCGTIWTAVGPLPKTPPLNLVRLLLSETTYSLKTPFKQLHKVHAGKHF